MGSVAGRAALGSLWRAVPAGATLSAVRMGVKDEVSWRSPLKEDSTDEPSGGGLGQSHRKARRQRRGTRSQDWRATPGSLGEGDQGTGRDRAFALQHHHLKGRSGSTPEVRMGCLSGYHLFSGAGACSKITGSGIAWAFFGRAPLGESP